MSGSDSVNLRQFFDLRFHPLLLCCPMLPHLVVHLQRGGFVDRDHHGFALKATAKEMLNDVLRDFLQSVVARDDVILPPELALQFFSASSFSSASSISS